METVVAVERTLKLRELGFESVDRIDEKVCFDAMYKVYYNNYSPTPGVVTPVVTSGGGEVTGGAVEGVFGGAVDGGGAVEGVGGAVEGGGDVGVVGTIVGTLGVAPVVDGTAVVVRLGVTAVVVPTAREEQRIQTCTHSRSFELAIKRVRSASQVKQSKSHSILFLLFFIMTHFVHFLPIQTTVYSITLQKLRNCVSYHSMTSSGTKLYLQQMTLGALCSFFEWLLE